MLYLVSGINSNLSLCQPHSDTSSSISDSPIPSPITSSSFFDSPLCSSITPFLFHSRLKTYHVSQILPTVVSLLPPGLPSRTVAGPFLLKYSLGFYFFTSFLYILFLVPCAGFSWPSRQLLSARKYTVSYRIRPMIHFMVIGQTATKIYRFFKMSAVHHHAFIVGLRVFGPPKKSICVLHQCAKFAWNRCSSFDNMQP